MEYKSSFFIKLFYPLLKKLKNINSFKIRQFKIILGFIGLIIISGVFSTFIINIQEIKAQSPVVIIQTQQIDNSVDVSFSPSQLQQNKTASVTIRLKDNDSRTSTVSTTSGITAKLFVCASSATDCKTSAGSQSSNGRSITFNFAVNSNIFKIGNNFVEGTIETTSQQAAGITFYTGFTQVVVLAASNTEGSSLSIVSTGDSFTSQSSVTRSFTLTYNKGNSNRQPTSFVVECGNGKNGVQRISNGLTSYECVYDGSQQTYTVKGTASDNIGVIVSQSLQTQITGNEYLQGSGAEKKSDDGNSLLGFINKIITIILGLLNEIIYFLFYWLVAPIIQAMLSIQTYKDTFVNVIYPGWEIIRNLCNIFFIVALIAIAIGTLLRVKAYEYKDLLVQLVLGALLVNFSLVISQVILGIADTIQAQFLPNNVEVIRALARDLMVTNTRSAFFDLGIAQMGTFADTVSLFFYVALSFGSFFVFAAIAALLLVRIVWLWILLMLSPVAFVANALPGTKHFAQEWWKNFIKYAFFAPAMAFFLNMAAIMARTQPQLLRDITGSDFASSNSPGLTSFIFKVASNVLLLIFLFASLKVAEQFGIMGADAISKMGTKATLAPFGAAGFLGKAAGSFVKKHYDKRTSEWANGGWLARQAFKVAHAPSFVKAVREEGKKERELYQLRVQAGSTEVARKQFGWRRKTESPMYLFDEHKGKEQYEEEEGEWSDNEQIVVGIGNRLLEEAQKGDLRAQIKLKHWFVEALRHKNLNEAMEGENGLAKNHLGGKLNYNTNNIRYFFQKLKDEKIIDENFTKEFLKKLSKDGYEIGDYNAVELVYNDPKTNHPHLIKMLPPDEKGNSKPEGWDDQKDASGRVVKEGYVTRRQELIEEADEKGRKIAADKYGFVVDQEGNTVVDEDGKPKIDAKDEQIGVIIADRLKELEDEVAKEDHGYENAMHADRASMYMKINMSKKKGFQQLDMFHDSIFNINVKTGEVEVSDAGEEVMDLTASKMYALGRDNMAKKTQDKFMMYINAIKENKDVGLAKLEGDLTKIRRAKYRVAGVKVSEDRIKREVAEQRNLWLGAGYEVESSTPGATVMREYFENTKGADDTRDRLINSILKFEPKHGVGSVDQGDDD